MANPWAVLRGWGGWRGLADSLHELSELLRRAGEAELADQIGLLLADPAAVAGRLPSDYRVEVWLGRAQPAADDDDGLDVEAELAGWIADLARQVLAVPQLLAMPQSAEMLGQALTTELPRMWQGRFGALLMRLRSMGGGAGRSGAGRSGVEKAGARRGSGSAWADEARADEPGHEPPRDWPGGESWQPQFAAPGAGGYLVVLPLGASPAELLAVRKELLYFILRELGLDAARLHLLLTTAGTAELDGAVAEAALGLAGQKQLSRQVRGDRCRAAVKALQAVRLSVLRWHLADGTFRYEHSEHPLWALKLREYGQSIFLEQDGALVTRGEQWAVLPGPESWAPALAEPGLVQHQAIFSSIILEELQGRKEPLSLAMAVLLAFGSRLSVGEPLAVPNRQIVRLAGLEDLMASTDGVQPLAQRLRKAARLQRRWGWVADFSDWPREGEEAFLQATTLFHFDADAAAT